jgi:hypothetical protein
MWCKKKWITIAGLVATVVVLAGIIGGVVFAQAGNTLADNTAGKTLLARVATILNIDQTKLEAAFTQAQKDMQNEALTNHLNSLVQQGTITQQQADQYKQWWQSKPSVPAGVDFGGMGGPRGGGGMPGPGGPGGNPPPAPTATPKSS